LDFDLIPPDRPRDPAAGGGFTLRVDGPKLPDRRRRPTGERRRAPGGGTPRNRERRPVSGGQRSGSGASDMTQRILYALPAIAVLAAATVAGGIVFAAAAALLACVTIWELCRAAA